MATLTQNSVTINPGNGGSLAEGTEITPPLVASPVLDASKDASSPFIFPGEIFNYTITVTNVGPVPTSNPFTITDALPPGITLYGQPTSSAGPVTNNGTASLLDLLVAGEIPPGKTVTITIPVIVASDIPPGVMTSNSATIDPGNGGDQTTVTELTPPIVDTPIVTVTKTSSASALSVNGTRTYTYTLTITNDSDVPTSNPFTITDNLPPYVTLNAGVTSSAGPVTNSGTNTNLNLSIAGSIPPGGTATVTIPVIIAANTPPGILAPNTADVNPGNDGEIASGTDKNPPSVYDAIVNGAKTASTTLTHQGDTFYYTLTLTNTGNAPTSDPFVFEEQLPPGVTLAGNPTSDTLTINSLGANTFSASPAINPGDTVTINIPVTVSNEIGMGSLEPNVVQVQSDPNNPASNITVTEVIPPVVAPPVLTATKSASSPYLVPGDVFNYTLTITNTGEAPTANPFTITDILPNNVTLAGTPTSDAGDVTNNGTNQNLSLSVAGVINPGDTVTIIIPVKLSDAQGAGPLDANSGVIDPGNGGNPTTATEETPPIVDTPSLEVNKAADIDQGSPGEVFNYTITITNNSNVPLSNPFNVTDALPPNLTLNGPITSSLGTVTNSGTNTNLNLSVAGTLAPGATMTLTIPVIISGTAPIGPLGSNVAVVNPGNGGQSESATDKNPPIIYAPVLDMTKTSDVTTTHPNGIFNYVVTITNTGNFPTSDPFLIEDLLPYGLTSAGPALVDEGTLTTGGTPTNLSLSYSPALAPGATLTITIPVLVDGNVTTGYVGQNTVSAYPGNNGNNASASDTTQPAIEAPTLTATKNATDTILYPGEIYAYEITITNDGNVPTMNPFNVTDALPPGVTYMGNATTNLDNTVISSGTDTAPNFAIYYNLKPGESITLTIPVQLSQTATTGTLAANRGTVDGGNGSDEVSVVEDAPPTIQTPEVNVVKSSSVQTVTPGETFSYTITITNNSAVPTANPYTVTDILPDYITLNGGVVASSGTVVNTGDNQNLNLQLTPALNPGESVTLTIPVIVDSGATIGDITANATTVDPGNGGEAMVGTDKNTPTVKYPILDVTKGADTQLTYPCGTFNYIVTVTNTGNSPTASPLTFTDELPQYLSLNGTVTSDVGAVTNYGDANYLDLSIDTSLASGEQMTLTIPVVVDCSAPSETLDSNTVSVIGGNTKPSTGNDKLPPVITKEGQIGNGTKTADCLCVYPGDVLTYTITATNTGNSAIQVFTITDHLPVITLQNGHQIPVTLRTSSIKATVDGNPVKVTVSGSNGIPVFTLVDGANNPLPIPAGAKIILTYQVRIPSDICQRQTMTNTATFFDTTVVKDTGVTIDVPHFTCNCCYCKPKVKTVCHSWYRSW